jgi:PAS domain S-box-containing protein
MNQQLIKILLVEDNPGDVMLLNEMLKREELQFEMTANSSLGEAVESLSSGGYELLILDLMLPDSTGIETLISVKKYCSSIPVIVLTGTNDYITGTRAIAEGAQDYLIKEEADGKSLMRSIRYARERQRLMLELEQERKKELKISEARYRAIVEDQTELICRLTPDCIITFVNGAYCRFFKGGTADFIGRQFKFQLPEASRESAANSVSALNAGNHFAVFEYWYINESNGRKRWLEWTCRAIFDENSVIKEYQAVGLDITERKHAEENLQVINDNLEVLIKDRTYELAYTNSKLEKEILQRKQAEESLESEKERLAVTLRSIGEGVIAVDNHMKVTLINDMAELIVGWTFKEAIGRNLDEIFFLYNSLNGRKIENPAGESINSGEMIMFGHQTKILSKNNTEIYASITCAPIRDKSDKIIGAILAFRDMSEHKKVEEELLKISKLESLSLLASGIAHDFNNFLTGIVGNISLGKMLAPPEGEIYKILTSAEDISFQAKELTVQLLTFARGGTANKKLTNIGELLKNSINFMARGSNVKCEFNISETLAHVEIDVGQINQVVSNLVINSIQAVPDGGLIKVSAENINILGEKPPLKTGRFVKIIFKDNGCGIEEKNLTKIFDPYFTTKAKGNGLGLSSVYSIIKSHGGLITAESKPGEGASFIIYLPAAKGTAVESDAEIKPAEAKDKKTDMKRKILIMDDEELIRNITSQLLNHLGFETRTAPDGAEAIEIYKKAMNSDRPFDLVITDLTVPGGMGGVEMLQKIIEFDPGVKAIAASGYFSDQSKIEDFEKSGFKEYITKPFKINELVKTINIIIDAK